MVSCSNIVHQVSAPTSNQIIEAQKLVNKTELNKPKKKSYNEIQNYISNIKNQLLPAAYEICFNYSEKQNDICGWEIKYQEKDEFNAFASKSNEVTLYSGIFNTLENETEIAFVLSHEISHHILNHISESSRNIHLGNLIGSAVGIATVKDDYSMTSTEKYDVISTSSNIGEKLGSLVFSREQENEADLFALLIMKEAGYDLDLAKNAIIKITKINKDESLRSDFFDTHPSGFERVANYSKNLNSDLLLKSNPDNNIKSEGYIFINNIKKKSGQSTKLIKLTRLVSGMCIYQDNENNISIPRDNGCKKYIELR